MTNRPTKIVINCATGEESILELTDEEIAEREALKLAAEKEKLEREAAENTKATNRANAISKLTALGLTEEEVIALL